VTVAAARISSAEQLEELREQIRSSRDPEQLRITVCGGTGCRANGSAELAEALRGEIAERGLGEKVELKMSGCHGFCQQGPVVLVDPQGVFYRQVGLEDREADARDIIESAVRGGAPVERLLYPDPKTGEKVQRYADIPFYAMQQRIALSNNGKIDPGEIDDYIAAGGYAALAAAFRTDPEEIINTISKSGLRGRGGGGFPTGRKWSFCRGAPDRTMRYVICNADEGDPGAFMDRSIMEGDPHSVLEGMAVGAYAMSRGICPAGGYIYIRAEYPLAVENVRKAIAQAEDYGLLGDGILGTDFDFHVKIKEGAGAFVCGEETALIASIEGRRGAPRPRPPFPANRGLFGKPSNINNVETWANVPRILVNGAEWYAGIGTETSAGTKVFSLVGKVRNSGLVEVPMGISLREVVYEIGGGIPGDKKLKAVQTGGPSGGCIPAAMIDLPVDYEKLAEAGSIMGSGGLVVLDEDTCMVDLARYFVEFTQSESCGKCAPCRLGTKQMLSILEGICAGRGRMEDIDTLIRIGTAVKKGALCGLGQTAPNPVLTTIKYFRDEYEAHIKDKRCPATVCREIVGAPCRHTCPAGVDVPRYIRRISEMRYAEALDVVRERIPFAGACGWACFHPCETKCRRGQLDEPIAVRALKRFAVQRGSSKRRRRPPKPKPSGKKVAVVGAGPAGLTAGYYLARKGHAVTVYEKLDRAGGTLWTGIPDYRLPAEVIEADIKWIRRSGLRIRTGRPAPPVKKLLRKADAVVLSHGAHQGMKLGIPGEDGPRVIDCLTYLREAHSGRPRELGKRVAVIGGGNAAIDAARTARRLGGEEVTLLYRRTRAQMPASAEEIEAALAEGVGMEFLTVPTAAREEGQNLVLTCLRMELGPVDSSGRRRPVPIEGSEYEFRADAAIAAIGQGAEHPAGLECETDRRGWVVVDDQATTSTPGVFACGDAVTGPASVIEAIAGGRKVASAVDRFLGGDGDITETLAPPEEAEAGEMVEESEERPRVPIPERPVSERLSDGGEVEIGYSEEQALQEAGRCLRCDLEEQEE
jgi:NADH-quinone oxidoreductase subunit F